MLLEEGGFTKNKIDSKAILRYIVNYVYVFLIIAIYFIIIFFFFFVIY